MELMYRSVYLLRTQYHFNGYIHVKAIPGAPQELLEQMGYLADRMSINLELPTAEGLKELAPHKTQKAILKPMGQIQSRIANYRLSIGKDARMERSSGNRYLSGTIFDTSPKRCGRATPLSPDTYLPTAGIGQSGTFRSRRTKYADDHWGYR